MVILTILAAAAQLFAQGSEPPKAPQSRKDWANEKVIVVGRRGNLRAQVAGRTFRGTEGFADGSAPPDSPEAASRNAFSWQVYYHPDGTLEARFRRYGAVAPHGPLVDKVYRERGTWTIRDGWLCQTIPKVGSGAEVCYDLEFAGQRSAMYYATCGALTRCYEGRLGPEGVFSQGNTIAED
ncbi:MAG TPA: hypothetical protein DCL54_03975 [Alphaproteobacteria bacterium]|nr:hypothetical protein [Alphaproteobacteria bacterium]